MQVPEVVAEGGGEIGEQQAEAQRGALRVAVEEDGAVVGSGFGVGWGLW